MMIRHALTLYGELFVTVFSPRFFWFHCMAVFLTACLVLSGFDWMYAVFMFYHAPQTLLLLADMLGFILPILVPLNLWLLFLWKGKLSHRIQATALSYAVVLGFTISTMIKVFTGRTSPPHLHHGVVEPLVDTSRLFHFGFMREQIIGGWPSSHATIAFALAMTLVYVLPRNWQVKASSFILASFIGIGVTLGFHWFSECVAGALLGIVIGIVVGEYFRTTLE